MKKVIAFAVMVLMVTATHAVTIEWERTNEANKTINITKSFTAAIVITMNKANTGNDDLSILSLGSSRELLAYKASNGLGLHMNNYWSDNSPSSATGEHVAFMNFVVSGTQLDVYFYVDNTSDSEHATFSNYPSSFSTLPITFNSNNLWTINDFVIYDSVLTTEEMAKVVETKNTASVVPEPTCLALLALGVAGIALKRKVA